MSALCLPACGSTPSFYGASSDPVYITDQQIEVANCKPIESIRLADEHSRDGYGMDNQLQFRQRVARLGGNTGLVTSGTLDRPLEGIAFRCSVG